MFHPEFGEDGLHEVPARGGVGNAHRLVLHFLHEAPDPHADRRLVGVRPQTRP